MMLGAVRGLRGEGVPASMSSGRTELGDTEKEGKQEEEDVRTEGRVLERGGEEAVRPCGVERS